MIAPPLSVPLQSALAHIPAGIGCARDYALLARDFLAPATHEYIAGGCGADLTVRANAAAFSRWAVYPRLLCDLSGGHLRSTIDGELFEQPIMLAPVAFQKLAHPGGELESARAARATGTCLISSTLSSHTLEAIAAAAGPQRWFQLYFQPQPDQTLALVRRAEAAGYGAIVLTLDATIQVAGRRAVRAGFRMPADCVPVNLDGQPAPAQIEAGPHDNRIFQGVLRHAPTWPDLAWLIAQTRLPVWVKGVAHADDARRMQAAGVAGIVVSNHGGRGLDGAPASLDTLAPIRAAVGTALPVLFDGGIGSGTDIFKALALGADAVLIGRLQLYALSVAGALGVAHLLKLLGEELAVCMALAGCATLADIGPQSLMRCTPVAAEPVREGDCAIDSAIDADRHADRHAEAAATARQGRTPC